MNHQELCEKLIELGFPEGWGVRNGKIVVWDNEDQIPDSLSEYIELD